MKESRADERSAALTCIAIIDGHLPLNDGEKQLLSVIKNQIRLAFDLEGAVRPEAMCDDSGMTSEVPKVWFW
jgi:hypothetical protein